MLFRSTEYGNHKTDHESGAGAPGEGKGERKDSAAAETAAQGDAAPARDNAASDKVASDKAAPASKATAAA